MYQKKKVAEKMKTALGPTQVLFRGVEPSERQADDSPQSSAETTHT